MLVANNPAARDIAERVEAEPLPPDVPSEWFEALDAGELPPADADFGDAEATAPLRTIVGELALPSLAKGTAATPLNAVTSTLKATSGASTVLPNAASLDELPAAINKV